GVANVAIWGQRDRQIQVLVDPRRLRTRKLTLDTIIATAGNAQLVSPLTFLHASTPGTGGFLDGPNQRLSVRQQLPLAKPIILALVAYLLEWRAVLISALTIPLALLAAVWALDALGYTVNALVIAGLLMSVAIVIDQAIAASDEIARVVRTRRAEGSEESTGT